MADRVMETKWIHPGEDLSEAAALLRQGQLVAFPTETVYGLGADAMNADAVTAIYAAKGRPSDNPLIVHVYPGFDLQRVVKEVPVKAKQLMDVFWPGPLTLCMYKNPAVPDRTTGGLDTVGVRMPSHPVALELLKLADIPVAAPSANASGRPSPTTAAHVFEDMQGKIPLIVDGGDCEVGVESTFVDMTGEIPMILRPGYVTKEMLESVIGPVAVEPSIVKGLAIAQDEHPRSPGMKYRHYAPKANMVLLEGKPEDQCAYIEKRLREAGDQVGLLISGPLLQKLTPLLAEHPEVTVENLGDSPKEMTHRLFGALRRFDETGCTLILGEAFPDTGVGMALMNRMLRAAGGNRIQVSEGK